MSDEINNIMEAVIETMKTPGRWEIENSFGGASLYKDTCTGVECIISSDTIRLACITLEDSDLAEKAWKALRDSQASAMEKKRVEALIQLKKMYGGSK